MSTCLEKLPTIQEINYEKCRRARESFWSFCKVISPDFYKEDRPHLKTLCEYLERLYNGDISNLIIQMPPRHGKSRTLINFTAWLLGKDNTNKIITASFNDDLAQDFSRYTRDLIQEEKNIHTDIVYSDIFEDTQVKKGDASYKKWSLEGQYFNYKGTGIGGSVTGKGGNWQIIDDPVKDAEIAYNPDALAKIWRWYTGTFLSRGEKAKKILCMTPWAKGDLAYMLLEEEPEEWEVLTMPAYDGEMLCPELLDYDEYKKKERIADEAIFAANYKMERVDIKGRLYSGFGTYEELPETTGKGGYIDTADEGKDFLCAIFYETKDLFYYITDIIYTQDAQEVTEPLTCDTIILNDTKTVVIESNNGGRAFARNVERLLKEKGNRCSVRWFHQSKNKIARIMTNAATAQKYVLFPSDWKIRWPQFYEALSTYQKEGKNKNDDAPDALTGIIEKNINRKATGHFK